MHVRIMTCNYVGKHNDLKMRPVIYFLLQYLWKLRKYKGATSAGDMLVSTILVTSMFKENIRYNFQRLNDCQAIVVNTL